MKSMNLLACSILLCTSFYIKAQSDTPCAGGVIVAPALPVSASCSYTNGTTIGATLQTDAANAGTPSCGNMAPDVFYSFVAPSSGTVMITAAAGTLTDGVMALYSGSCGSWTQLACSDDVNGTMPQITQTGLTPGATYLVRIWQFGGGTGTFSICVRSMTVSDPGNNINCSNLSPVCSGIPVAYVANSGVPDASDANPGNLYGCVATSQNPSWFYLEISQAGDLSLDLAAPEDIDFAIWGPFTSLSNAQSTCNSYPNPVDCTYSPAEVEHTTINGVTAGEFYVLLVTNYPNANQVISITASATNTAGTDCAFISLPVRYSNWELETANGAVNLFWKTESEEKNNRFVIQRSANEMTWEKLGEVTGQGTTSAAHSYQYTDEKPLTGISYYRLMQLDNNGKKNFTQVLSANMAAEQPLIVYPNPASDRFTINEKNIDELTVTNVIGISHAVSFTKTVRGIEIDCSLLAPGIYNLSFVDQGLSKSGKLVVQR